MDKKMTEEKLNPLPEFEKLAKDFCAQKQEHIMQQLEDLIKDGTLVIYQDQGQTKLDRREDGSYIMTRTQRVGLVADAEIKIINLKLEIVRLREALEFYAATNSVGMCCCDGGEIAREALGMESFDDETKPHWPGVE